MVCQTTRTTFKEQKFSVLRRYSDFFWLYEYLCEHHPFNILPVRPALCMLTANEHTHSLFCGWVVADARVERLFPPR